MPSAFSRCLTVLGVDPRGYAALLRALVLMALRGQHYTKATGTKPSHVVSPLFWVVGQCLTASAVASLVLFARVDVWFFAFVNLSLSLVIIATTVLVEFQEVVIDPADLLVLGPRPVEPRTYAAARFTLLLGYFVMMYLALNLIPLFVGAGLRDAGAGFLPAYFVASLAGNLVVVGLVIGLLSMGQTSAKLEGLKQVLAWSQIVLILVLVYGGQLMFRDETYQVLLWGAFPPAWVDYLPSTWLAWFVEQAAVAPGWTTLYVAVGLLALGVVTVVLTVWRLTWLYRTMQPATYAVSRRPMPAAAVGGLRYGLTGLLNFSAEERVGFWLALRFLRRDPDLFMRCLLPFSTVIAVVCLGVGARQFADPFVVRDAALIGLPVLAVYLVGLAVPPILNNLSYTRNPEASWVFTAAPLGSPVRVGWGACKAVLLVMLTPLCLVMGVVEGVLWQDPVSAGLHAGLAWLLAWPAGWAGLWLVVPDMPFSLKYAPGSSLGPIAVPMAVLGSVTLVLGTFHYLFGGTWWFWGVAAALAVAAIVPLRRQAYRRFERLAGRAA